MDITSNYNNHSRFKIFEKLKNETEQKTGGNKVIFPRILDFMYKIKFIFYGKTRKI